MSEYQYYEFRAVDRDLSPREIGYLERLSTRAEITPTSFTNFYTFGDFRGNPDRLVEKYFDAFVYVANWGTHRLALRLPQRLLDKQIVRRYCVTDYLECRRKGQYAVLEFLSEDEDGGWVEGSEWMDKLLGVREALLAGDLRALYLGWLGAVQMQALDEETAEPPVPPNLSRLTPPLRALVDFLRIDPDLVAAAAEASATAPDCAPRGPSRDEMARWIGKLPRADKDALLLRVVAGEETPARRELQRRFRDAQEKRRRGKPPAGTTAKRTVRELRAIGQVCRQEREERGARRKSSRKRYKSRKLTAARNEVLDFLAGRADEQWSKVEELLQTGRAKQYEKATEMLVDLRDALARANRREEFGTRFHDLHTRHARRRSFLKRLAKAGVTGK